MKFSLSAITIAIAALAAATEAHISFRYPCARLSSYDECQKPGPGQWELVDYNVRDPVGTHGNIVSPICKHGFSFPGATPIFHAGETVQTKMDVGAFHNGGSCQWALSYDNGTNWVVIQSELKTCLSTATSGSTFTIPVTIPANAPTSKNVIINWLWNNNMGNRELYSSCADIQIQGSNGGKLSGVKPLFANYGPSSPFIQEAALANGDYGQAFFAARPPITITVPPQTL